MKQSMPWIIPLLLIAISVQAHDHWIIWHATPDAGGTATLQIGSGHRFPDSDTQLAERLLADTSVIAPDKEVYPVAFKPEHDLWTADLIIDHPGVWIATFALRRPRQTVPIHRGRSILVVGGRDDTSRYISGEGMEIVPGEGIDTLAPGDHLPLRILVDGIPVGGTIAVTPENGRSTFFSTTAQRAAKPRLAEPGAYLITAAHGGQTFSLTLRVKQQTREE